MIADDARRIVERTCAEQALPLHVEDPNVLAAIARIIRRPRDGDGAPREEGATTGSTIPAATKTDREVQP